MFGISNNERGKGFIKKMKQVVNANLIKEKLPSKGNEWSNELKKREKEKPFFKHFSPARNKPNE